MAEYAPGIPEKGRVSPLPVVKAPKVWEFSAHPHLADRAGPHVDLRLGNPDTGIAHSFVIPKGVDLPKPGEHSRVIPTYDHTMEYQDFTGTIEKGYGKGKVIKGRREKAEVYHADPSDSRGTKLRFNLYSGKQPEEYSIRKDGDSWFLHNKTQTREKRPDIPDFKPKYKEISPDEVDAASPDQAMMPKLDGAHGIIDLKAGRAPRVFSYRIGKKTETGLIEHTHKIPQLLVKKVPKELDRTVLRAEILGVEDGGHRNDGAPIPVEQTGGLLNAKVWESRRKQEEDGIRLRAFPFSVVKYRGKDMTDAPFSEKMKVLSQVAKLLPELKPPPVVTDPNEKIKLLNDIRKGKHPLTSEGVVLVNPNGTEMIKAKFAPDWDTEIVGISKGRGKYEGRGIGGFIVKNQGSTFVVGSGLSDQLRQDAFENPDKYVGRIATVRAQSEFPSGKLRAPVFHRLHIEKGDTEKIAVSQEWLKRYVETGAAKASQNRLWDLYQRTAEKANVAYRRSHGIGTKLVEGVAYDAPLLKDSPAFREHAKRMSDKYGIVSDTAFDLSRNLVKTSTGFRMSCSK